MRSGGVRAWPSVVMLTGFGLVAGVYLALVTVPVWLLLSALPGSIAIRLGVPLCMATVGVMGSAIWRALHRRPSHPPGIPIGRSDAPALWGLIDAAARAAGVRPPDGITVMAEPTVALIERSHLLGLIGGRRDLYLGMPVLQAWDEARLRAAVAHEFGHVSTTLGRLAPMAHRGRVAVGRVVPRISRHNPARPLIRIWAAWYRRVDQPFARARELNADRIAAAAAGPVAAAAILRDGPALETLVHVFQTEYVAPGRRAGYVPDDLFGGLLRVLAARADEMALLGHRDPPDPPAWDPHPPRRDRLAALAAAYPGAVGRTARPSEEFADTDAGSDPRPTIDDRPGPASSAADVSAVPQAGAGAESAAAGPAAIHSVDVPVGAPGNGATPHARGAFQPDGADPLPEAPGPEAYTPERPGSTPVLGEREGEPAGDLVPDLPGLARALQAVAFPAQGRTAIGWDGFFDAARTAEMEREAESAVSAIARALGVPMVSAADVLDVAADGRLRKAVEVIFPDQPAEEADRRVDELVTLVLALAALRAGAARWRHSWTGAAELVTPDGGHLDLGRPVALAVDPATASTAREWLAELGIDPAAPGTGPAAGVRAEVLGGVVNLVVDGSRTDVLIVDTGLFLIPGLPRSQNGSAKRRLARFAAADAAQRDQAAAGSRFVPYADLTGAVQTRRAPRSWDLTLRSGDRLTVRTALDSDELPGGWAALEHAVAFLARSDPASVRSGQITTS